jgi:hypothetical protein
MNQRGIVLDPSNPDVLELVSRDTARIAKWGYELIKHDFTTIDTLSFHWEEDGNWHYYDRTITNATMLKRLYQTIQQAAREAEVLGCNTVNHLVAGIHAAQRSSEDTSGRYFEMTRRNGIASPTGSARFQPQTMPQSMTTKCMGSRESPISLIDPVRDGSTTPTARKSAAYTRPLVLTLFFCRFSIFSPPFSEHIKYYSINIWIVQLT